MQFFTDVFKQLFGQDSTIQYTWRKATALEAAQGKDSPDNKGMILEGKKVYFESVAEINNRKFLNQIKSVAQSAVGVKFDALSITQLRALYAIDLFYKGAFDSTLKVRPLKDWIKN